MSSVSDLLTEAEQKAAKEQEQLWSAFIGDMRDIMSDVRVQRLLIYLLDFSNINGNNYTGDVNSTILNLGRAESGYHLLELMEQVDPTLYPRILLNHAKERMK